MYHCHAGDEVSHIERLRCHSLTTCGYLDHINVSNARLAGMQEDCNMTDVEWSAGISLFYVGYIISQIPANIIIAKGQATYLTALLYAGLVCCDYLHDRYEEPVVVHALSVPRWCDRRAFPAWRGTHDVLVVHKAGISAAVRTIYLASTRCDTITDIP